MVLSGSFCPHIRMNYLAEGTDKEAAATTVSQPDNSKMPKNCLTGQKFGVQQKYGQNEDGSYWLDMHGRVSADHIVFLNQLITTGEFLNQFCQMNVSAG